MAPRRTTRRNSVSLSQAEVIPEVDEQFTSGENFDFLKDVTDADESPQLRVTRSRRSSVCLNPPPKVAKTRRRETLKPVPEDDLVDRVKRRRSNEMTKVTKKPPVKKAKSPPAKLVREMKKAKSPVSKPARKQKKVEEEKPLLVLEESPTKGIMANNFYQSPVKAVKSNLLSPTKAAPAASVSPTKRVISPIKPIFSPTKKISKNKTLNEEDILASLTKASPEATVIPTKKVISPTKPILSPTKKVSKNKTLNEEDILASLEAESENSSTDQKKPPKSSKIVIPADKIKPATKTINIKSPLLVAKAKGSKASRIPIKSPTTTPRTAAVKKAKSLTVKLTQVKQTLPLKRPITPKAKTNINVKKAEVTLEPEEVKASPENVKVEANPIANEVETTSKVEDQTKKVTGAEAVKGKLSKAKKVETTPETKATPEIENTEADQETEESDAIAGTEKSEATPKTEDSMKKVTGAKSLRDKVLKSKKSTTVKAESKTKSDKKRKEKNDRAVTTPLPDVNPSTEEPSKADNNDNTSDLAKSSPLTLSMKDTKVIKNSKSKSLKEKEVDAPQFKGEKETSIKTPKSVLNKESKTQTPKGPAKTPKNDDKKNLTATKTPKDAVTKEKKVVKDDSKLKKTPKVIGKKPENKSVVKVQNKENQSPKLKVVSDVEKVKGKKRTLEGVNTPPPTANKRIKLDISSTKSVTAKTVVKTPKPVSKPLTLVKSEKKTPKQVSKPLAPMKSEKKTPKQVSKVKQQRTPKVASPVQGSLKKPLKRLAGKISTPAQVKPSDLLKKNLKKQVDTKITDKIESRPTTSPYLMDTTDDVDNGDSSPVFRKVEQETEQVVLKANITGTPARAVSRKRKFGTALQPTPLVLQPTHLHLLEQSSLLEKRQSVSSSTPLKPEAEQQCLPHPLEAMEATPIKPPQPTQEPASPQPQMVTGSLAKLVKCVIM